MPFASCLQLRTPPTRAPTLPEQATELSAAEKAHAGALMRVNHVGEIEVISDLISELLTLSSLQAGDPVRSFEPFDLVALIQAVIDDAAFERPDRPVRLTAAIG